VLAPGANTTAALLYDLFHPGEGRLEHVHFAEILPALERGAADYGVCIHEGRFTWQGRGLTCVEDLGLRWEQLSGGPLPLGGLCVRRSLGADAAARITRAVRASLAWADGHREAALCVMREHAAEDSDEHLWKHVELYVNAETRVLGPAGRAALLRFGEEARRRGRVPPGAPALAVTGEPCE
jgi:1,4-dihydroxy-6-naphthoate synthase